MTSPDSGDSRAAFGAGDLCPDFELTDVHGALLTRADLGGSAFAIIFFPFAFSPICSSEIDDLDRALRERDEHGEGIPVLGVTCDSMFTLRAWTQIREIDTVFFSDFWPHGRVARAFGAFDQAAGHALRGSFVIDSDHRFSYAEVGESGISRNLEALADVIAST